MRPTTAAFALAVLTPALASCGGNERNGDMTRTPTASTTTRDASTARRTQLASTPGVSGKYRLAPSSGGPVDVTLTRVIAPLPLQPTEERLFGFRSARGHATENLPVPPAGHCSRPRPRQVGSARRMRMSDRAPSLRSR